MNDHDHRERYLPLLLVGSIGLTALLLWVSNLTSGPEYGGRYDIPAINSGAWFAFLLSAVGTFILLLVNLDRLGRWVESRDRSRSARQD